jgi:hypothetical protein
MRPLFLALAASLAALTVATAADERPKNIRVCVQLIEVPHPVLTELLAGPNTSGPALHDQALALAKDGTVKLLETSVVTCHHGQKASVESIRELIYPTEYEPSVLISELGQTPPPPEKPRLRPDSVTAWETRNVGTTLEIEPSLPADTNLIDLRFVPEIVQLVRMNTFMEYVDEWGDASVRMPVLETSRLNTSVSLMPGQFEMVGAITPKPNTPGPAVTRKLLVFVRADILPVPYPP